VFHEGAAALTATPHVVIFQCRWGGSGGYALILHTHRQIHGTTCGDPVCKGYPYGAAC